MVRFVVMAAGLATRMGRDKLALPWKKTSVLGYVVETVLETMKLENSLPKCELEIHVISRQPIETYLSDSGIREFRECGGIWRFVPSPRPLAEIISLGLEDIGENIHSISFLPGDQVGINVQELSACLAEVLKLKPDFLVPFAGDLTGSPVFFNRRYIPEILELQGEQGGRVVLNRYPERWLKFPVKESLFDDVDTPEEYEALYNSIHSI